MWKNDVKGDCVEKLFARYISIVTSSRRHDLHMSKLFMKREFCDLQNVSGSELAIHNLTLV